MPYQIAEFVTNIHENSSYSGASLHIIEFNRTGS